MLLVEALLLERQRISGTHARTCRTRRSASSRHVWARTTPNCRSASEPREHAIGGGRRASVASVFRTRLATDERPDGPQAIAVRLKRWTIWQMRERQSGLNDRARSARCSFAEHQGNNPRPTRPSCRPDARATGPGGAERGQLSWRSLLCWSDRSGFAMPSRQNDLDLSGTLVLLGDQSLFEGDAPAARRLYLASLEIRRSHLRPDHPQIAVVLKNLGGATRDLGDYPEAKALRERALSIAETNFGPVHPLWPTISTISRTTTCCLASMRLPAFSTSAP